MYNPTRYALPASSTVERRAACGETREASPVRAKRDLGVAFYAVLLSGG